MLFFIQMGLTLGIFLLLHFVIGSYPQALQKSAKRRREIWEALALWGLLGKYNIDPAGFLMVGNSLRSDILPVLGIGGQAVYIPNETT